MVAKFKSLLEKHPRFAFLCIGLVVSFFVSAAVMRYADKTIEEYRSINQVVMTEYRSKVEQQSKKLEQLTEENRTLRQRTKTYKIVKPDGTIEERSESESESTEQIATEVREEWAKKITEETNRKIEEYTERLQKVERTRTKLEVNVGLLGDLGSQRVFTRVGYDVLPPFTLGGGVVFGPQPAYLLDVGVRI